VLKLETESRLKRIGRRIPRSLGGYEKSVVLINRIQVVLCFRGGFKSVCFGGLAEGVNHKVQIVNVQVKRHQTAAVFIGHPVIPAPFRAAAEAGHRAGKQITVGLFVINLFNYFILGPKTQNLRYHKFNVILFCRAVNAGDILFFKRNGLFAEDINAPFHCLYREIGV